MPPEVYFEGYGVINDQILAVSAADGVLANDIDLDGRPR